MPLLLGAKFFLFVQCFQALYPGLPHGTISIEKALNFQIRPFFLFKFCSLPLITVLQMFFALCSMNNILEK